jgi:glyoxylase-like metal-dependent hydrolase (beta-lactamase superfamily II)
MRYQSAWILLIGAVSSSAASAQTSHFTSELLPAVRRAASLIPGDAPSSIHVERLSRDRQPLATAIETDSRDSIAIDNVVFQVRFPRGWLVVDAAEDHEFEPSLPYWSDEVYRRIHKLMRDARLIVITHEHGDHVAGVLRSTYLALIQAHTVLTRAQARTLMTDPGDPRIKIDSAIAARFTVLDYDPLMPIAPGVVLIKSPGHTPGSQLVYVRLQSGAEMIFAGDVAWHSAGIELQRQKPEAALKAFGVIEDANAVATELRWLKDVGTAGIPVVVSHDGSQIDELVKRGLIVSGYDMKNR